MRLTLKGCSPIAQLVEQMTVNHWVTGSSPVRGAIQASSFHAKPLADNKFDTTSILLDAVNISEPMVMRPWQR